MEICRLLYADTLFFCDTEAGQVSFIRLMLLIFETYSGPSLNWRKSNISPIKEVQMEELAGIWGA